MEDKELSKKPFQQWKIEAGMEEITVEETVMDKLTRIEGDYKAIVQSQNPLIPPIFGADKCGLCCEWNEAMTRLTEWKREEMMDKLLLGEIFGGEDAYCPLKNQEAFDNFATVLENAETGSETEKVAFGFFSRSKKYVECQLSVSEKLDVEGLVITGVLCFLHLASPELQQELYGIPQETFFKTLRALNYLNTATRNALSGIMFCRRMLEDNNSRETQNQLLHIIDLCQGQLSKVLDDGDFKLILDGHLSPESEKFILQEVLVTSLRQVFVQSDRKGIQIINQTAEEILKATLFGDGLRLQQVIVDFLLTCIKFTSENGQILISASLTGKKQIAESFHTCMLELSITHDDRVPDALVNQMFGIDDTRSDEGFSMLISRQLLTRMNGRVAYLREATKASFILSAEVVLKV